MDVLIVGAGLMGRAIAFDLLNFSNNSKVTVVDKEKKFLEETKNFLKDKDIYLDILDINDLERIKQVFKKNDIAISAVPYNFNYNLTKLAIETNTHFIDLGGNNDIVQKQKTLKKQATKNKVIIIPDCGLAPGMVSTITRDIVENLDAINSVKLRVGGLPQKPKPPLNYQIVFSPNGLINEYVEDTLVLENNQIKTKKSMTEIEHITFPEPFGKMEAFLTSGGCSTLPFTYRKIIKNLDYKTLRYPDHCKNFKQIFNLKENNRKKLINKLLEEIPTKGEDVVLLKAIGKGSKNNKKQKIEYTIIDYYDQKNKISAMMRTTAYPVSIIAQLIEKQIINTPGVFTPEEIIPPKYFFEELEKRNIKINKKITGS
jgi:lysine 6-dehydrogenase